LSPVKLTQPCRVEESTLAKAHGSKYGNTSTHFLKEHQRISVSIGT
jgi:hypothetical protein